MDELLKELREVMKKLNEYRALKPDAVTDELKADFKANITRAEKLEGEIADMKKAMELEERMAATTNMPKIKADGLIVIEDQPIYRGLWQLGQQMRDVFLSGNNSAPLELRNQAKSRLEQVEKRADAINKIDNIDDRNVEERAAGTGGMVESVGVDGGFLLQTETALDLFTKGFNNNAVLSRTDNRTLSGPNNSVEIIGIDETSRATGSRGGGVRVYTGAELGLKTQSKTALEKIRIEPKKLYGFYFASDEILQDVAMLQGEMASLFNEEFAFKGQDLIMEGSGVGEPLGLKSATALVAVGKETGQDAKTIVTENIIKMKSRAWLGGLQNMVWLINQDVEPQLLTLSLAVGTGGAHFPLYTPGGVGSNGIFGSMMGFPVIPIEQCETLGTAGDIYLVNLKQYITANKGGINAAMSIHLKFDYDQTAFRFVWRFDGQPRWANSLLPFKPNSDSDRISPYVSLAVRS